MTLLVNVRQQLNNLMIRASWKYVETGYCQCFGCRQYAFHNQQLHQERPMTPVCHQPGSKILKSDTISAFELTCADHCCRYQRDSSLKYQAIVTARHWHRFANMAGSSQSKPTRLQELGDSY